MDEEFEEETTLNEILIDEIPIEREKAKEQNIKTQMKQKEYHDRKIKKKHEFRVGDKVLYYNAAKEKQWSGKLEEKWKGPYYIHEILLKGSYKIKDMNGKILRTPVNGELLKKYLDRESFESFIFVE